MRHSRRAIVPNSGAYVHKIWRFHNRTFGLKLEGIRSLYLICTLAAIGHKSVQGKIKLSAYCIMSNHSHQLIHSTAESKWLSKFMQIALTKFARIYNNQHKRTGAVGNGRPKTIPIQGTDSALMRTHMYIEANPIRAGIRKFENLKLYEFSSFKFYAYGILDKTTSQLQIPEWYIRLGESALTRQATYRSLFKKYLELSKSKETSWPKMGLHAYFGELSWVYEQLRNLRKSEVLKRIETSRENQNLAPPLVQECTS